MRSHVKHQLHDSQEWLSVGRQRRLLMGAKDRFSVTAMRMENTSTGTSGRPELDLAQYNFSDFE